MINSFYLPILKSKEGEFSALSKLNLFTRNHLCPLFEITPLEFDSQTGKKPKTLEEHLHNFCHKRFLKKWGDSQSFIDAHMLDDSEINAGSCLAYIYSQIGQQILMPITPVPVARLKSSDSQRKAIKDVLSGHDIKDLALRIKMEDISIDLEDKISDVLSQLEFSADNVHLIFDLSDSDFTYLNDFSDAIVTVLEGFPNFKDWKSFTICSGAFPPTGNLLKGENYIPRNDWKLYQEIVRKLASSKVDNRKINYGDYGIVSPGYFQFDPMKMSRSANIRYTLDDSWFVLKGSALKKSEDYEQYVEQAKKNYWTGFFPWRIFLTR